MSYPYNYMWPKDRSTFGFYGPVNRETRINTFHAAIINQNDIMQLIRSAIQRILRTRKGERVMQPNFRF
jgi:hypothetical protein